MAGDDGQIHGAANGLELTIRSQPLEGQRRVHEETGHIHRVRQRHARSDQHGAIDAVVPRIDTVLIEQGHLRQLGFGLVEAGVRHIPEQTGDAASLPFPAQTIFILAPDKFRNDSLHAIETDGPGLRQIRMSGVAAQNQRAAYRRQRRHRGLQNEGLQLLGHLLQGVGFLVDEAGVPPQGGSNAEILHHRSERARAHRAIATDQDADRQAPDQLNILVGVHVEMPAVQHGAVAGHHNAILNFNGKDDSHGGIPHMRGRRRACISLCKQRVLW